MEKDNVYKTLADKYGQIAAYMAKAHPQRKWLFEPQAQHWQELSLAAETGQPIVWFNFGVAPEIFIAMDLLPQMVENLSAMRAGFPEAGFVESVDVAHQQIPDYLCSAHKSAIGGLLDEALPLPQVLVGSSHPCDSGRQGLSMIADYYKIPYFAVDVPYTSGEFAYRHVAKQIERLVTFLEETTDRKLDPDKLREVMKYSNETQKYAIMVSRLRRAIPCPTSGKELGADAAVYTTMVGSPEALEYYKNRYETAKEKVEKGEGALANEKLRLVYITTPTFFNPELLAWLEKDYGAVIVSHMMDYHLYEPSGDSSDLKQIYYNIAKKCVLLPMANHYRGPADVFVNYCLSMARDFEAHAAVFLGGMACRSGWALIKLAKDRLRDEMNIPMLTIEVDYGDPRITPHEEMRAKFENFMNIIS